MCGVWWVGCTLCVWCVVGGVHFVCVCGGGGVGSTLIIFMYIGKNPSIGFVFMQSPLQCHVHMMAVIESLILVIDYLTTLLPTQ